MPTNQSVLRSQTSFNSADNNKNSVSLPQRSKKVCCSNKDFAIRKARASSHEHWLDQKDRHSIRVSIFLRKEALEGYGASSSPITSLDLTVTEVFLCMLKGDGVNSSSISEFFKHEINGLLVESTFYSMRVLMLLVVALAKKIMFGPVTLQNNNNNGVHLNPPKKVAIAPPKNSAK